MANSLDLSPGRLALDGTPSVLLCSSVFPFRIPRTQWDHRLRLVQESGYRMVDLYVHWGFHEEEPGRIDFDSPERDLRHFLDLARRRDLLVMARPGPYICSETDGGGLPWWLHGEAAGAPAALRTSDPDYLAAVDRWYGAVMPILAAAQTDRGGAVALVQLENELDFYDCPDPDAYMAHLAERARELGIVVPLIGCAGQGDLAGATGGADGLIPTVNLYPDDSSPTFDAEARHYHGALEASGLPLMVTETNRLHRTLRREILAGARLVAPYLQTSGFDHLVLPSAGNWGDPGNLMTHDYDFGGYLSPDGRRRPEYDEAIALAATLSAWGERLATAAPEPLDAAALEGVESGGALALAGGGHLVGPAELDGLQRPVRLRSAALAGADGSTDGVAAVLEPGGCPFWSLDVPLAPWGVEGTLAVATAELVAVEPAVPDREEGLLLTFEGRESSRIEVVLPVDGGATERLRLDGPGTARSIAPGTPVTIVLRPRPAGRADPEPVLRRADMELLPLGGVLDEAAAAPQETGGTTSLGAEARGLPDGRLTAEFELSAEASEVLLLGAADLVRVGVDGVDQGVQVTHGAPLSFPLTPGRAHRLRATAEIWGRANFDDARRPALALGAGRGVGRVLEVLSAQDATDLWEVRRLPDRRALGELDQPPLRGLGGWSSTNPGVQTTYVRTLSRGTDGEVAVLRLVGLTHPVHVALDGGEEQRVMPEAPVLVLAPDGTHGGDIEVRVRAPHVPGGLLERVEVLSARRPRRTALRTLTEAGLAALLTRRAVEAGGDGWRPLRHIGSSTSAASSAGLHIAADAPVLLRMREGSEESTGAAGGMLLEVDGDDVQVTVIAGGRRVSRHVLGRPVTAGGSPHRSWIPAGWRAPEEPEVLLLVEALEARGGIFDGVRIAPTPR
ncbi:beta-galactosidase [Brachybacterium saurashtrense]|uniref:Glycoside hydrolase 35 catalytic domain-containing protein n=1 Tax=Brachybacterium saurashtrense TaxID=556288 RepID=A0A345YQX5_9MICO|nr:beta-galactosidase [Brachybacterium saurashtrense]AXK46327.1 hypothetical protein DWV08_12365 [Brachybacterium saurashtrense]RRR24067.1 hypothetical protein DXU92_04115 [Brachybacterium saurashtrense]